MLKHKSPFLYNLWTRTGTFKTKHGQKVADFIDACLERPSSSVSSSSTSTTTTTGKDASLADFTVAAKLKSFAPDLTPSEIYSECADHLFAGVETTGDTLCFMMWHISQPAHMAIQRRLQAELRGLVASPCDDERVAEAEVDQKLHSLPYLNAVIDEGLRLFTAGALSLPRETPRSRSPASPAGGGGGGGGGEGGEVIDGYFIPGGTTVASQPYTVHRDERTYPDPEEFLPERWLTTTTSTSTSTDQGKEQVTYAPADLNTEFLAFGKGSRACIGKQ